jgi:transcriptional regulator GlxA family with amidase domain
MTSCLKWTYFIILGQGVTIVIGVLVFPDFQLQDAAGPISVFEVAARYAGVSPAIRILAATPDAVRSSSGVEVFASGFGAARAITTLIVVGGENKRYGPHPNGRPYIVLTGWERRIAART